MPSISKNFLRVRLPRLAATKMYVGRAANKTGIQKEHCHVTRHFTRCRACAYKFFSSRIRRFSCPVPVSREYIPAPHIHRYSGRKATTRSRNTALPQRHQISFFTSCRSRRFTQFPARSDAIDAPTVLPFVAKKSTRSADATHRNTASVTVVTSDTRRRAMYEADDIGWVSRTRKSAPLPSRTPQMPSCRRTIRCQFRRETMVAKSNGADFGRMLVIFPFAVVNRGRRYLRMYGGVYADGADEINGGHCA